MLQDNDWSKEQGLAENANTSLFGFIFALKIPVYYRARSWTGINYSLRPKFNKALKCNCEHVFKSHALQLDLSMFLSVLLNWGQFFPSTAVYIANKNFKQLLEPALPAPGKKDVTQQMYLYMKKAQGELSLITVSTCSMHGFSLHSSLLD